MSATTRRRNRAKGIDVSDAQADELRVLVKDWYEAVIGGINSCDWGEHSRDSIRATNAELTRRLRLFGFTADECDIIVETPR